MSDTITLFPARGIVILKQAGPELSTIRSGSTIEVVSEKPSEIGVVYQVGLPKLNADGEEIPLYLEDLKPGDVVAYRRYGEAKMYVGSTQYFFVDQADLLSVIKIN